MKFTEKTFDSWFDKDSDITTRKLVKFGKQIFVCFIDCLVDKKLIADSIISPILQIKNDYLQNCSLNVEVEFDKLR